MASQTEHKAFDLFHSCPLYPLPCPYRLTVSDFDVQIPCIALSTSRYPEHSLTTSVYAAVLHHSASTRVRFMTLADYPY